MSAARHVWQGWHGWWRVLVTACLAFAIVAGVSAQSAQEDVRLVSAVQEQNTARIQQLLNEGVDVTVARADGVTALLWAAHWDDQATADLLLEAGADPNAAEDQGVTPLARAAENTSAAMVSKLLAAGDTETAVGIVPDHHNRECIERWGRDVVHRRIRFTLEAGIGPSIDVAVPRRHGVDEVGQRNPLELVTGSDLLGELLDGVGLEEIAVVRHVGGTELPSRPLHRFLIEDAHSGPE